jgi:hypothetical protein
MNEGILPVLGMAFAAFTIWLTMRVINRGWKPGRRFYAIVFLAAPLVYPVSFGPACWISSRSGGTKIVAFVYQPILETCVTPRKSIVKDVALWYARIGAARKWQWIRAISDPKSKFEWTILDDDWSGR